MVCPWIWLDHLIVSACQIGYSGKPQGGRNTRVSLECGPIFTADSFLRSLSSLKMLKRHLVEFSV